MIYDRTHGPRAGYFGLELRVGGKTDQTETFAANFMSGKKAYFVESHDVGLSFRSLNLLSICCVGPERQKQFKTFHKRVRTEL